jgi:hypothetical protein
LYPKASFVAIFAIGYPVALDAKTEERDTRVDFNRYDIFFSSGETANCTLQPQEVPMLRIIKLHNHAFFWNVVSDKVIAGATVMESQYESPLDPYFKNKMTTLSFLSLKSSNHILSNPLKLCQSTS